MTNTPPSLTETPADKIIIVTRFPETRPETIFEYWTRPELLKKWWPPEAELTLEKNGSYHFWWPKQNWHLRGKITEIALGKKLAFTWKWDHETIDETDVEVAFDPLSSVGTVLTLQHAGYHSDEDGKRIRKEHVEGWMYFLGRLLELCVVPEADEKRRL